MGGLYISYRFRTREKGISASTVKVLEVTTDESKLQIPGETLKAVGGTGTRLTKQDVIWESVCLGCTRKQLCTAQKGKAFLPFLPKNCPDFGSCLLD